MLENYQNRKFQLQKECDQLKFAMKKFEKANKHQAEAAIKQYDKEIRGKEEKSKLIDFQIEQLHILPLGSELKETELQAVVELQVGDSWESFLGSQTIIIKDGVVAEIRER
nr:YlqD family protein [Mesobacillus harenae]